MMMKMMKITNSFQIKTMKIKMVTLIQMIHFQDKMEMMIRMVHNSQIVIIMKILMHLLFE